MVRQHLRGADVIPMIAQRVWAGGGTCVGGAAHGSLVVVFGKTVMLAISTSSELTVPNLVNKDAFFASHWLYRGDPKV